MTPCPRCGAPEPMNIVPDGIWYDPKTNAPLTIAYRCGCGTNRSRSWAEANHQERIDAHLAEMARDSKSEMMTGRG